MSEVFLEVFDKIFSLVILPPFKVGYWRGTCHLLSFLLYKKDIEIRSWIFLIIGIFGNFILTVFQRQIKVFLNPETSKIRYFIGSRFYTIISSLISINELRCMWNLFDLYIVINDKTVLLIVVVVVINLGAFKGIRNISDTPYVLVRDCYEHYFDIPTRFQMSVCKFKFQLKS